MKETFLATKLFSNATWKRIGATILITCLLLFLFPGAGETSLIYDFDNNNINGSIYILKYSAVLLYFFCTMFGFETDSLELSAKENNISSFQLFLGHSIWNAIVFISYWMLAGVTFYLGKCRGFSDYFTNSPSAAFLDFFRHPEIYVHFPQQNVLAWINIIILFCLLSISAAYTYFERRYLLKRLFATIWIVLMSIFSFTDFKNPLGLNAVIYPLIIVFQFIRVYSYSKDAKTIPPIVESISATKSLDNRAYPIVLSILLSIAGIMAYIPVSNSISKLAISDIPVLHSDSDTSAANGLRVSFTEKYANCLCWDITTKIGDYKNIIVNDSNNYEYQLISDVKFSFNRKSNQYSLDNWGLFSSNGRQIIFDKVDGILYAVETEINTKAEINRIKLFEYKDNEETNVIKLYYHDKWCGFIFSNGYCCVLETNDTDAYKLVFVTNVFDSKNLAYDLSYRYAEDYSGVDCKMAFDGNSLAVMLGSNRAGFQYHDALTIFVYTSEGCEFSGRVYTPYAKVHFMSSLLAYNNEYSLDLSTVELNWE